jgi:hypothetical protein
MATCVGAEDILYECKEEVKHPRIPYFRGFIHLLTFDIGNGIIWTKSKTTFMTLDVRTHGITRLMLNIKAFILMEKRIGGTGILGWIAVAFCIAGVWLMFYPLTSGIWSLGYTLELWAIGGLLIVLDNFKIRFERRK